MSENTVPEIAIVMNNDADLPVMQAASRVLDQFGVPYQMDILAIHTHPDRVKEFAQQAEGRGVKVIIAGAGGAAHLPGMLAAYTPLPVIGVPVKVAYSIDGLDAIYSMLQMPMGIPVATMALNNAENAAIFALQVLGLKHSSYLHLVHAYKNNLRDRAHQMSQDLQTLGYDAYVEQKLGGAQPKTAEDD